MRFSFLFLIIGFYCIPCALYAQEYERKKDSTDREIKRKYEEFNDKPDNGKLSRFLNRVLIKDPNRKSISREIESRPTFKHAQGKIIRSIEIVTLDPFGYSVNDTTEMPDKWIERAGNTAHVRSSRLAVRNYLLFRKNKALDSTTILESERILRSQQFIRRVQIEAHSVGVASDSVDVKIRVLDSWSTILVPNLSSSGYKIRLRERNFMGLGHTFHNKIQHRTDDGKMAYSANYKIPNIYNTYISSNLRFTTDLDDNQFKRVGFNREFYSNIAKWAGGVEVSELYYRDSLPNAQQDYEMQPVKYFEQKYWGGYSVPIVNNPESAYANYRMVSSVAYETKNFSEVPTQEYDSIGYYSNDRHLLFKIALSSNSYVQDKYIFRYDEIEDIPVGVLYSITTGIRKKRDRNQPYLGGRYSFGNYHRIGYVGGDLQVGGFYDRGKIYQAAVNLKFTYFTPIFDMGSWRLRQFVTQSLVYGINRDPIIIDNLGLLGESGIKGFNETVYGNKRAVLTLQTQTYSPWAWQGFRFNPFFNTTLGLVSEKGKTLVKGPLHTRIGIGVLITNDYFVVDRFQLSFSYYPHIPANGSHILDINGIRNYHLRLPHFNSTRPEVVPYINPRENGFR